VVFKKEDLRSLQEILFAKATSEGQKENIQFSDKKGAY